MLLPLNAIFPSNFVAGKFLGLRQKAASFFAKIAQEWTLAPLLLKSLPPSETSQAMSPFCFAFSTTIQTASGMAL